MIKNSIFLVFISLFSRSLYSASLIINTSDEKQVKMDISLIEYSTTLHEMVQDLNVTGDVEVYVPIAEAELTFLIKVLRGLRESVANLNTILPGEPKLEDLRKNDYYLKKVFNLLCEHLKVLPELNSLEKLNKQVDLLQAVHHLHVPEIEAGLLEYLSKELSKGAVEKLLEEDEETTAVFQKIKQVPAHFTLLDFLRDQEAQKTFHESYTKETIGVNTYNQFFGGTRKSSLNFSPGGQRVVFSSTPCLSKSASRLKRAVVVRSIQEGRDQVIDLEESDNLEHPSVVFSPQERRVVVLCGANPVNGIDIFGDAKVYDLVNKKELFSCNLSALIEETVLLPSAALHWTPFNTVLFSKDGSNIIFGFYHKTKTICRIVVIDGYTGKICGQQEGTFALVAEIPHVSIEFLNQCLEDICPYEEQCIASSGSSGWWSSGINQKKLPLWSRNESNNITTYISEQGEILCFDSITFNPKDCGKHKPLYRIQDSDMYNTDSAIDVSPDGLRVAAFNSKTQKLKLLGLDPGIKKAQETKHQFDLSLGKLSKEDSAEYLGFKKQKTTD